MSTWESNSKFCANCKAELKLFPHRFRPPTKDNIKKWDIVIYLFENGFRYGHVYDDKLANYVKIPENMNDAVEFINTYKNLL